MTPKEMREEADFELECIDHHSDVDRARAGIKSAMWRSTAEICERLDRLLDGTIGPPIDEKPPTGASE